MYVPQRHGCLTAWLTLIIVAGLFGLIVMVLVPQMPHGPGYRPPEPWVVWAIAACMLIDIACAFLMFLLSKWGFYGYVLANLVLCGINFAKGIDVGHAIVPLIWVACLIGVMRIGSPRYRAWKRLR